MRVFALLMVMGLMATHAAAENALKSFLVDSRIEWRRPDPRAGLLNAVDLEEAKSACLLTVFEPGIDLKEWQELLLFVECMKRHDGWAWRVKDAPPQSSPPGYEAFGQYKPPAPKGDYGWLSPTPPEVKK